MWPSEIEKRAIIIRCIDNVMPKIKKVIGRNFKELLDENKQLKEENERLKKELEKKEDS